MQLVNNKSILTTSAAGFIGSHVVRCFVNKYSNYNIFNLYALTYAVDASKINQNLGLSPIVTFEEGLFKTFDWYFDNKEWLDNAISGDYQNYYKSHYK
jgi:dTDP-D-glucose 4,6-dehydratase